MTKLSDIVPNLNPGQSGFNVGTEVVNFIQRSTDIVLTAAELGKTIFINATQEINVTLPDATVIGTAKHNAFGFEILGATVNLRDADGNLLTWFDGMDVDHAYQTPEGMVGCILHLIDFSSAAGKWMPAIISGNIYGPKLRGTATASLAEMDIWQQWIAYGGRHQQFKSFNPVKLDNDRTLYMWRQIGSTGQKARVVKLNRTTGAISFGSVVTIDATDSQGYLTGVLMQNNYGINNTDVVLTYGQYNGTNYVLRAYEVDDTTISVGTAVLVPATDDNADTVDRNLIEPSLVRLSGTKALLTGRMVNVTDASRWKPYALHVTLSGDPPTTVTAGTPVNLKGPADASNWSSSHYGFHDLITGVADRVLWLNGYAWDRGVVLNTSGTDPAISYELGADDIPYDNGGNTNAYGFMDPNITGRFIINDDRNEYIYEVILGASGVNSVTKIDFLSFLSGSAGQASVTTVGLERTSNSTTYMHLHDDDWRRLMQVSNSDSNITGTIHDRWNRERSYNLGTLSTNLTDRDQARSPVWRNLGVPWRGNLSAPKLVLMESNRWVLLSSQDNDTAPGDDSEYHFASFEIPEF